MLKAIQITIGILVGSLIAVVLYHGVVLGQFTNNINF
jgi:hypothetical protein